LRINKKNYFNSGGYWPALGIGAVIGLMFLVRYNNIFAALIWPFVLLGNNRFGSGRARSWKRITLAYAVSVVLIIGFKIWPDFLNPHPGYAFLSGVYCQVYPVSFYVERGTVYSYFVWGRLGADLYCTIYSYWPYCFILFPVSTKKTAIDMFDAYGG
jgi:hypothetical protein